MSQRVIQHLFVLKVGFRGLFSAGDFVLFPDDQVTVDVLRIDHENRVSAIYDVIAGSNVD